MAPAAKRTNYSSDPLIMKLVEEKQHKNSMLKSNLVQDRKETQRDVRGIQKNIRNRLTDIENLKADSLAEVINSTDNTRRMFEANRTLAGISTTNSITVNNSEGNAIFTDAGKAQEAKRFFERQLTEGVDVGLSAFAGEPRPLDCPITPEEVAYAASRLKTNRATGPDKMQNELLKYADPIVYEIYSESINSSFSTQRYITSIGEGYITPLQKPGKPKGPLTSLRPLTLLNGSRKILTLITLRRIEQKVDDYTMAWQCGYKHGRSCADIVWAQRMMISVVLRKHWTYNKMGIDMSRAFDTVKRTTIIDLLHEAGCSVDDIRLVQYLLSNTKLKVRVNNSLSEEFESLLGAFQGDSLSGKLFTLVLAAAMHHLRAYSGRPNPPVSDLGMPLEWEYADDCDFADEDVAVLQKIEKHAQHILPQWNLIVNEAKTEYVEVYLAKKGDTDDNNQPLINNEPWRSSKSLGSLLCTEKDIANRCIKGEVAFRKFQKVWLMRTKISLDKKLKLYEAQVVSVMMYNANSWSPTKAALHKLDVTHRRHLRRILNITYPGQISNATLYKRCNVDKLSDRVAKHRWRMLGHILRSDENTAAHQALSFAVETNDLYKGRVGRPRCNLFSLLTKDLADRNLFISNFNELNDVRDIARCRTCWKNLFDYSLHF